ncbi:MAG: dihydroorotase [Gammaproteobacteria bacterium]|nr:dihydroorotase [Gammaproteobacteria bacterium]
MKELMLTRPDDMHLHLRDGAALAAVVASSARCFARAIVMPNLQPPVTTIEQALAYRQRILAALPAGLDFEPLMTLYLTGNTRPAEIKRLAGHASVLAVKYYPAGATFNADNGVTTIEKAYPVIEQMAISGVPLLMHGEVNDPGVDIFDREQVFIETILDPLLNRFPGLRVVFEHITTEQAVRYVEQGPATLAATITPQHLLYNRNAIFDHGIRPHYYCLPVLKREPHRLALVAAATSGHPRFFLGTDSAPHAQSAKESACGCAGIYSAPVALEIYIEIFERAGVLDRLEAFASHFGADFYGLPRNTGTIRLQQKDWNIPTTLPYLDDCIIPMRAGEICHWRLVADV